MLSDHQRRKGQKEHLSMFGRWYYALCDYLQVSGKELARRAGVDHSTISRNTQLSTPSYKTMIMIIETMEKTARDQDTPWSESLKDKLFHAAGYATPREKEDADRSLEVFLHRRMHGEDLEDL